MIIKYDKIWGYRVVVNIVLDILPSIEGVSNILNV